MEWSVLERQIPTSSSSQHAEFSIEGLAKPGGPGRGGEAWRETVRLRTGLHQHAKTPYVTVEVELEAAAARKSGRPGRAPLERNGGNHPRSNGCESQGGGSCPSV